jgi:hypothetical protein
MRVLASLQRQNSRFALKQFPLRALRCGGMVPEKISNVPRQRHIGIPGTVYLILDIF